MKGTVLLTGGSGFVGSAVLGGLLERGYRVIATTTDTENRAVPSGSRFEWVAWDARLQALPPVPWSEIDVVLHLATPREPLSFPANADSLFDVNVAATYHLLEQVRARGRGRVLLASTADVLSPEAPPALEADVHYGPDSFYGASKAAAEILTRAYAQYVSTAILRLFHPYGPGGERFLVNRLLDRVIAGQEVFTEAGPGIELNPVWIDDLADGICLAIDSEATGIFNFAGPETVTMRRLLDICGEISGRTPNVLSHDHRAVPRHVGLVKRSRDLLGYSPRVGVKEGLTKQLAFLRSGG